MSEPKGVVYLLRHAHDFKLTEDQKKAGKKESDLWERPADGKDFTEKLPDGRTVTFPWKRLSPVGQNEAEVIKGFVASPAATQNGAFAPINHWVAQDPSGNNNSQNTFYTIWPAVNNNFGAAKMNLLGLDGNFNEDTILSLLTTKGATTSTMICLDRQHLWGYKRKADGHHERDDEGKKIKQDYSDAPEESSVMGRLGAKLYDNFQSRWKSELQGKFKGLEKGGIIYRLSTSADGTKLEMSSFYLDSDGHGGYKGVKNEVKIL